MFMHPDISRQLTRERQRDMLTRAQRLQAARRLQAASGTTRHHEQVSRHGVSLATAPARRRPLSSGVSLSGIVRLITGINGRPGISWARQMRLR